ncbi:MAG: hypothetical protein R3Y10_06940 [Ferrimonas sp.]
MTRYHDHDLQGACQQGIFTPQQVTQFQQWHRNQSQHDGALPLLNQGLLTVASLTFLGCGALLIGFVSRYWALAGTAGLAWFIAAALQRRTPSPLAEAPLLANTLMVVFQLTLMGLSYDLARLYGLEASGLGIATLVGLVAATLHWWRFQVAITWAATIASCGYCIALGLLQAEWLSRAALMPFTWLLGLGCLALAIAWDRRSSVRYPRLTSEGFWLHLVAAPMVVYPLFDWAQLWQSQLDIKRIGLALVLYGGLSWVSLMINRRALMIAALSALLGRTVSLFYVSSSDALQLQVALTGLLIGAALLMLSLYWQPLRQRLLSHYPAAWRAWLPR